MRLLSVIAFSFAACAPAHAQSAPPQDASAAALVEAVTSCRDVADAQARLACYDRAAAALADAKANRGLVVVDREEVKRTRRSLFGFKLPRIKLFGGGDKEDPEDREISAVIRTAVPQKGGHWTIVLEEGSRWQTIEPKFGFEPRAGATITIEKAALGSYFAKVGQGRTARVRRVE